jgi:hypothetical protein
MEAGMVCQVKPIERLEEVSIRLAQKYPDLQLLSKIKERLGTLVEPVHLNPTITQAIAVVLQSPPYLDGLQEKDLPFQAWKQASYEFLYKEFGKENLVYLQLNQDGPIAAIHCIFVPIQSNQLVPQAFVGTLTHQQGYLNRYQAVLDRLFTQSSYQANGLQAGQAPRASQHTGPIRAGNHHILDESIKDGLDRIKRINLVDYLIHHHGYEKNKEKSSEKWPRLDHGDGTKLLLHEYKGIHYYESLQDELDSGTIVDYMLRRGRGSYQEIIAEVSGRPLSIFISNPTSNQQQTSNEPVKDPAQQQKRAQDKLDKFPSNYGKTYLEKRGIEPATYQLTQGVKTNTQGAIFGLYTKVDIQGQGQLCSTIQYYQKIDGDDGKSCKYFQKGLPRGLSVLKSSWEIKEIVVTESPIDALSHKQLHGTKQTLYLSTCGSIGKEIARSLEAVFIQAKEQSIGVKLGFDGDEKGREMAQQVVVIASKCGITCQIEFPKVGKDWNDMLVTSKQQIAQLDQPKIASVGRAL